MGPHALDEDQAQAVARPSNVDQHRPTVTIADQRKCRPEALKAGWPAVGVSWPPRHALLLAEVGRQVGKAGTEVGGGYGQCGVQQDDPPVDVP